MLKNEFPERPPRDDHGLYDAGYLHALIQSHASLVTHTADSRHARPWSVSWFIEPRKETPWTLQDYQNDAADRISEVLQQREGWTASMVREHRKLLEHWAHSIVQAGVLVHGQRPMPEGDTMRPATADDVLATSRNDLYDLAKNKVMLAKTPLHPQWGRGQFARSRSGMAGYAANANTAQQNIARDLIGPHINIRMTAESKASDIIREAIPELLELDTRWIAIHQSTIRKQMTALLQQANPFTEDKREQALELIIQMWEMLNINNEEKIAALQEKFGTEETKSLLATGNVPLLAKTYLEPAIAAAKTAEDAEEISQLLSHLTLLCLAEKKRDELAALMMLWEREIKHTAHSRRSSGLAIMGVMTMDPEREAKDIIAYL